MAHAASYICVAAPWDGCDIVAVKELLGHSTVVVTLRYAHSNDEALAEPGSDSALKQMKLGRIGTGGMGEWLKPAVLKTVSGVTRSGVRIPLPPPSYLSGIAHRFDSRFVWIYN